MYDGVDVKQAGTSDRLHTQQSPDSSPALSVRWNRDAADLHKNLTNQGLDSRSGPGKEVSAILNGFSIDHAATDHAPAVVAWPNDHSNNPKALQEFTNSLPRLKREGVQSVGMEFLDKNGEKMAQKYLDDRAAHKSKSELDADRKNLTDYLHGQYNSSGRDGRMTDDIVKAIEAAGDNGMRVVGLEPNIDHILSPTGGLRFVHSGLRHMTEDDRGAVNDYLDPKGKVDSRQAAREKLDGELKNAGWDERRRNSYFKALDQMRNANPPMTLPDNPKDPGYIKLPPDKDSEQHPDGHWGALKQEWRNKAWAQNISDVIGDPHNPKTRMVVYGGIGHFERPQAKDPKLQRNGQHQVSGREEILPDYLKKLGIDSYVEYPNALERRTHHK